MTTFVKHPDTGKFVTPNENNSDYGVVRVDSETCTFNKGFLNVEKRTAFVPGKVSNLEMWVKLGQPTGKVAVHESFQPFYDNQVAKINPSTGEEVKVDGKPVYRKAFYTEDAADVDILIKATVATEIKAATASILSANENN